MAKFGGYLQLRRGIFEHVKDGRMSHMGAVAFIYIASQADTRTGVWNGSASSLAGELAFSPRNARRLIERLSDSGYIKRFPVPGRHVCYPILVNKFIVTDGEHKGEQLNALESIGPNHLKYTWGEQECAQTGEHKGQDSASQKRIENREVRIEKKDSHHGLAMMSGSEFKKTKAKAKRESVIHSNWERFSELFNHYFHVPPTDGKTQRNAYEKCCRNDGEKWVLMALTDFAKDTENHGFDDITAAGLVFLTTEYENYRWCEYSKRNLDYTEADWWPESAEAPFFAKWFGTPVAAKLKAASASKNR